MSKIIGVTVGTPLGVDKIKEKIKLQTAVQEAVGTALQDAKDSGAFDGPQGPAGPTGPQGPQGDTGPAGADGAKGDKGDKGDTGATGPTGPAGADGKNGADGKPGADGKTPVKGTDYWTDADKQEIVDEVLDQMPEGGSGGVSVQSDWNQTDETAADFIKNRPFGDVETVYVDDEALAFEGGMGTFETSDFVPVGGTVTVKMDGVTYVCEVVAFDMDVFFGNLSQITGGEDTGEPFTGIYAVDFGGVILMHTDTTAYSHAVKITGVKPQKLSPNYYDTTRLLFGNADDGYLYTVIGGGDEFKATKEDVAQNVGRSTITIMNGLLSYIAIAVDIREDFAAVTVIKDGEYYTYFTAEYPGT